MDLICADIGGGSESVAMARKVLEWKRQCPASEFWTSLAEQNKSAIKLLRHLFERIQHEPKAQQEIDRLAKIPHQEWTCQPASSLNELLLEIRTTYLDIRQRMRYI